MKEIDMYVYYPYINKMVEKYEEELIEGEKLQQYLNTLELWENRYKKISLTKKNELRYALQILY